MRIKGALWRQEQANRQSLTGAWYAASFMRQKRLPSLKTLLREPVRRVEGRQTPDQQRAFFLEFARRAGLKVERHEKPVIQYPVM